MSSTRNVVLKLYKTMLREAEKFPSYNYRTYALRRIRASFRENKSQTNPAEIDKAIQYATDNLGAIRRQVVVGKLYSTEKLVIEERPERK
ncbi:LYR motif-containing protein 4 [Schistocerca americana]|uniref:LYR motif-containing protein 4 n=1 Tax=Schistocerca americana TaxID=7009 RepID=UPI001F5008E1|nr:LYR motif-containing protein 4 [Schistocerca americana]